MPRTIYDRRDLLNSNYLYQPASDESPVIVRDQCLDECASFDGDVAVRTESKKQSPSPACSQNVSKRGLSGAFSMSIASMPFDFKIDGLAGSWTG